MPPPTDAMPPADPTPPTDARSAPPVPSPRPAPDADVPSPRSGPEAGPAAARAAAGGDELTERERSILAFEQQWWRHAGAKEQAIRDTFGLSATRYYQLLNALLDRPAALVAEPLLIGRLRRLRASRARNRRR
ncbi:MULTISPECIES: DUF3263 domain-containing protein [unclassified Micromonospora]|uniref:DUF3263 domain-containing protein n=1 Tax=unclassified Micromonospora TaxID=2617518 RepID=UPI00281506E5|nr:DUF3263 domain-containing protein [Micromonospora sp. S-DT3-3-22]